MSRLPHADEEVDAFAIDTKDDKDNDATDIQSAKRPEAGSKRDGRSFYDEMLPIFLEICRMAEELGPEYCAWLEKELKNLLEECRTMRKEELKKKRAMADLEGTAKKRNIGSEYA